MAALTGARSSMFVVHSTRRVLLLRGALGLTATAIVVAVILAVDPEPASVVLGIALASSLSRSQWERDGRGRLEALLLLPPVGLATMGLGALLHSVFWVGAVVYVLALVGVTLLRRFGETGRRVSAVASTPLLAVLFLPAGAGADHGPAVAVVEPLLIAVLAWAVVTAVHLAARRLGIIPRIPSTTPDAASRRPAGAAHAPTARLRPTATTRMATQVGAAATVAFFVGALGFGSHWAWVVLSTVIVAYLPRGRADAVSKGLHRFVGAAAGSLVALVPLSIAPDRTPLVAAAALTAIGVGILLREVSYAIWAFCVTIALTLLERLGGQASPLIGMRLVEIVIGVAIGIVVVCVVFPIRTSDIVRARLTIVLAAVSDRLSAETEATRSDADLRIASAAHELDRVCAPLREAGRVLRLLRCPPPDAVTWAHDAHVVADAAVRGSAPGSGSLRRAVGEARRALKSPSTLGEKLQRAAEVA